MEFPKKIFAARLCLLFALSLFWNLSAQAEGNNKAVATPATGWTAYLLGHHQITLQPSLFYNRTRGSFDGTGHYTPLPPGNSIDQVQAFLLMQAGLSQNWEIDGQVVYQQNRATVSTAAAQTNGFGDSYLYARKNLVTETPSRPHVTGILQLKIPTGKYQNANPSKLGTDLMGNSTGGGSWDPGFGVTVSKKILPVVLNGNLSASFPQPVNVDGVNNLYGNYFNIDATAGYAFNKKLRIFIEVIGQLQENDKQNGQTISSSGNNFLTLSPEIGWTVFNIHTLMAYQRIVAGQNQDANDSLALTVTVSF